MSNQTPASPSLHAAGDESSEVGKFDVEKERQKRADELDKMMREVFVPHDAIIAVHNAVTAAIESNLSQALLRAESPKAIETMLVRAAFENSRKALGFEEGDDALEAHDDEKIRQICASMNEDIRRAVLNSLQTQLDRWLKNVKNDEEKERLEKIFQYLRVQLGGVKPSGEETQIDKLHHRIEELAKELRKRLGMSGTQEKSEDK